jgi:ectoine hydroxylase-related dioxygenase (phytanoyl-CoA dioxygenase family)
MIRFMFEVRKSVLQFFRRFLDSSDVISSFDGLGVFRNHNLPALKKTKTKALWPHVDQGMAIGDIHNCTQGLLNLLPADETTGGFCVVPGSHEYFTKALTTVKRPKAN